MKRLKPSYFFIGLAVILAIYALAIWVIGSRQLKEDAKNPLPVDHNSVAQPPMVPEPELPAPPSSLKELGIELHAASPSELVNRISQALQSEQLDGFSRMIQAGTLDAQSLTQLKAMADKYPEMGRPDRMREVGETELNQRSRWALEYDRQDGSRDRIYLDIKRDGNKWALEKISIPEKIARGEAVATKDSLGAAEEFLQAVLQQKFELARQYVDVSKVSDARIAGLCILFEEGKYRLREQKPLRAMYQRPDAAGYLANIEATEGTQAAQFSLNLMLLDSPAKWVVSEINLDILLADYATRFAGGDAYYSPLVKNPEGGDTLALYFDFDEDEINPRTKRQLEIVSLIMKSDSGKKINLSGHTDARGTETYNNELSERRAAVVRDYLIRAGVDVAQIVTLAKGASQPRRPNFTESGTDNPEGRRANRRTEIYLDF